jgi:hypothetical protein
MNRLHDSKALVSVTELAEIIDSDPTTIDNWLRRKIISRAPLKRRNRMFSAEEVYKTALKHQLVKLGIPPSSASGVVNVLWGHWDRKEPPEGRRLYTLLVPRDGKWTPLLCWQKLSGGPLYKLGRSTSTPEEIKLPAQAFAVLPVSDILVRIAHKLGKLEQNGILGS